MYNYAGRFSNFVLRLTPVAYSYYHKEKSQQKVRLKHPGSCETPRIFYLFVRLNIAAVALNYIKSVSG